MTCDDMDILNIVLYIKVLIDIMKIGGPLIVVIMSSVDVARAVMANNQEDIQKNIHRIPNRLILCAALFLIPTLVTFAIDNVDANNQVTSCLQKANQADIQTAYEELALKAVETAEEKQTSGACNEARTAVNKIKDGDVKSAYIARIEAVEDAIKKNSATSGGSTTITNETINSSSEVVQFALKFIGLPYIWGGTDLQTSVDCSGFTQQIFKHFGVSLSHNAHQQATSDSGTIINGIENAIPGDLLFFDKENDGRYEHVGIYIGNGERIHASGVKSCPNVKRTCQVTVDNNLKKLKLIKRVLN